MHTGRAAAQDAAVTTPGDPVEYQPLRIQRFIVPVAFLLFVAVTEVTRIRPSRLGQRQMAVVEVRGGRPLLVPVRYGFERLSEALRAAAPGLQVDT